MKYLLYIVFMVLLFLTVNKVTNYDARMKEYNRHVCATYGYLEDCKTPKGGD